VKAIATEAGVAPGLVHYYFKSKEELFAEVVKETSFRMRSLFQELRDEADPRTFLDAALKTVRDQAREVPATYRTRYGLYPLALRSEVLASEIRSVFKEAREGIAESVRLALSSEVDADALATVLFACFDGLALQHQLDPEFDLDRAYAALTALLAASVSKG